MVQSNELSDLPSILLLCHEQLYTFAPFLYAPWVGQYMLEDVLRNPRGIPKWVFRVYVPLMCTGKWGCMRTLHRFSTDFASHLWLIYIAGNGLGF